MFLDQLSKEQQTLFLRMSSLLACADDVIVERKNDKGDDSLSPELQRALHQFFGRGNNSYKDYTLNQSVEELEHIKQALGMGEILQASTVKEIMIEIRDDFLDAIAPILKMYNNEASPEMRFNVAKTLLDKYMLDCGEEAWFENLLPEVRKVIVFELYALALADGLISAEEQRLLLHMAMALGVQEFIAKDLHEAALNINRAILEAKTIICE